MKKVLLVNTNTEKSPYPVPPLGLCLLAASIERSYEVRIYDGAFDEGKHLPDIVNELKPDYIGLSIRNIDDMDIMAGTNYSEPILKKFVEPLRKVTSSPLILGGSAFSILPEYFFHYYRADYGVIGEGEAVFPQLLDCLDRGSDPASVPGVFSGKMKDFVSSKKTVDLREMSFSEIDRKIDYARYRERASYPVQTKRGCAHRCIYCTYNCIEGCRYRTRPAEQIAHEIEQAAGRLGFTTFEFVDSTFNDPPGHAESICRAIARRKLNVRLRTMGVNPGNVSPRLIELMCAAGFAQIDCTPDSASPRMLSTLQKNFTLNELQNTARIVRDFDMPTMWFFIFGGPGETEKTIKESFDFIDSFVGKKDMVHMTFGLRIYPGTGLHRLAIAEKIVDPDDSLTQSRFYVSPELGIGALSAIIHDASRTRPHCVPVTETRPSTEMMHDAVALREKKNLNEPMFRTLLRLRYNMLGYEMPE